MCRDEDTGRARPARRQWGDARIGRDDNGAPKSGWYF